MDISLDERDNSKEQIHQNDRVEDDCDKEDKPLCVIESDWVASIETDDRTHEYLLKDRDVLAHPFVFPAPEISHLNVLLIGPFYLICVFYWVIIFMVYVNDLSDS